MAQNTEKETGDLFQHHTSTTVLMLLQNSQTQTSEIVDLLHKMEGNIFMLNKDKQPHVNALMNLNWLDRGSSFIEVYKAFMLNLLSANTFYLKPFLLMLIKKFMQDTVSSDIQDEEKKTKKAEKDFCHIHSLLQSLAKIVPMTTDVIFPLLEGMFPYYTKGTVVTEKYMRNILTITSYIPTLRRDILDLVVKEMLKLDVRLSRQAVMDAVRVKNEEDESIFQMDVGDAKSALLKSPVAMTHLVTGSLDAMLNLMFKYIYEICQPAGKLNWESTKKLYRELLSSFDKFIIPSHSSNHVQFIMFYICSFKEELAVGFIDYLWKKVTNPAIQAIYRQISACYIGSFLARATYISDKTAREVLTLMLKWLHSYLDQTSDQNNYADFARHTAFYSVSQTAFYIFCFKHNQFLEKKSDHKWAQSLNFQSLITSRLNPLKMCQPIITQTFSSAARTHQIAFCDTVIERNNRNSLPSSTQSLHVSGNTQLESYFPFDPYLLTESSSFIVPLYKEFKGSVADDASEDSEDDDDFLPDEEGGAASCSSSNAISVSYGKSPMEFLPYGISPGFKHAN